jgi:hypothetical protein
MYVLPPPGPTAKAKPGRQPVEKQNSKVEPARKGVGTLEPFTYCRREAPSMFRHSLTWSSLSRVCVGGLGARRAASGPARVPRRPDRRAREVASKSARVVVASNGMPSTFPSFHLVLFLLLSPFHFFSKKMHLFRPAEKWRPPKGRARPRKRSSAARRRNSASATLK